MAITEDQRIAVLVYHEDHPKAYPPEISKALGMYYHEVVQILREYEASRRRFKVEIDTEFFDRRTAERLLSVIGQGMEGIEAYIVDVTPCAANLSHGPGHQSESYCEQKGEHDTHGAIIMGMWEEWDDDEGRTDR